MKQDQLLNSYRILSSYLTSLTLGFTHLKLRYVIRHRNFPCGSVVKNPSASAEALGSILGSERSPGEGNGHPLQYSYLENSMDRGACQATVHGVTRS